MAKTVKALEKNIEISFGYVKKDLMSLNDSISNLNDKIQHLSLNHAGLLEQIGKIEKAISGKVKKTPQKKEVKKETLEFYDVKTKKKFKSAEYKIVSKSGKRFAVTKGEEGNDVYRIIGNANKKKVKAKTKISKKKAIKKSSKTPKKVVKETITY